MYVRSYLMAALLTFTLLMMVISGGNSGSDVSDGSHSDTLSVSCSPSEVPLISGKLYVVVNVRGEVNHDVHLDIIVDKDGVTPDYSDAVFSVASDPVMKIIEVTFSVSSSVPLQEHPIPVTILASLEDTTSTDTATANITDNRVGIGFLPESEQIRTCYPNKSCDLSLKVSRNASFIVSISLVNSEDKTVNHTSFAVKSDGDQHVQVTAPEVGVFTAILSVPKENETSVVWTRSHLQVRVIADRIENLTRENHILQDEYKKLDNDFKMLKANYLTLERIVNKLDARVLACDKVTCSESHTCKDGKCICKSDEDNCHDYALCDYCGSRGFCQGSLDDKHDYTCRCHNQDVTGKHCSVCKDDYCSGHGDCTVSDDDGQPSCECYEPFIGPKCEGCNDTSCDVGGICTVNEDGEPTLECLDNSTTTSAVSSTTTTSATSTTRSSSVNSITDDSSNLASASSPYPSNTLLYGGLIVFIAFLVICVAAYLAYHNRDKIYELFGVKKETVVEMAMRSRTKRTGGYKKLPTSIHDTLTHED